MAYNPYFTFADPQLQQAVVQEAQIAAAAEAARAQQRAQTLAAMRQERQLQADKQERQAIREGDIRRQDATEAERRRQFDASLSQRKSETEAYTGERATAAKEKAAEAAQVELYNNLLKGMERAGSRELMTSPELEARITSLTPERKEELRRRRLELFNTHLNSYKTVKDREDYLNSRIDQPVQGGKTPTVHDIFKEVQSSGLYRVNGNQIESLFGAPREDPLPETPTFHVPIGRPPSDASLAPESINDILGRMRPPTGSFLRQAAGALGGVGPMGPVLGERIGRELGGLFGRVPAAPQAVPTMLGNQGILAPPDYNGPAYDYGARFRVPEPLPEDFLAPPVFAPGY
jgi:hypothetical protein